MIQHDGRTYEGKAYYEGSYTSMEAEYLALKEAARVAADFFNPNEHLFFYTDCQPLVDKLIGPTDCEEWHERRQDFLGVLSEYANTWSLKWVPRKRNGEADALATTAMDKGRA